MDCAMIVCETPRLILRRFAPGDLDAVAELFGDEEVMRFSTGVRSREESRQWLEATLEGYERNDWGHWAVVSKDDGRVIGFCGLKQWDVDGRLETEIGYRYLPAYWGRGYGSEAASAVRDLGFGRFGFERLISLIEPANVGSCRVAEKAGLCHEKDTRKWGKELRVYAVSRL